MYKLSEVFEVMLDREMEDERDKDPECDASTDYSLKLSRVLMI